LPIEPIGIYFSPKTRNYFADTFMDSYEGFLYLLLQAHHEFQIVTPRTLNDFDGKIIILPDVKCVSDEEVAFFKNYLNEGNGLIVTEETGKYDGTGAERPDNPVHALLSITDGGQKTISSGETHFIYYDQCPGKKYSEITKKEFNAAAWDGKFQSTGFNTLNNEFVSELSQHFKYQPEIAISASPFVSAQTAMVENQPHVFLANFKGLKGNENAQQVPDEGITIRFADKPNAKIFYLPFLGEKVELKARQTDNQLECTLPALEKGGVVWQEF
jgi:hypothetical protein